MANQVDDGKNLVLSFGICITEKISTTPTLLTQEDTPTASNINDTPSIDILVRARSTQHQLLASDTWVFRA